MTSADGFASVKICLFSMDYIILYSWGSCQFAFGLSSGAHGHELKGNGAGICCPDLPRCVDSVLITSQADCRAKVDQLTVCHDSCEAPTRGWSRQKPLGEVITVTVAKNHWRYDGAFRPRGDENYPMPLDADGTHVGVEDETGGYLTPCLGIHSLPDSHEGLTDHGELPKSPLHLSLRLIFLL